MNSRPTDSSRRHDLRFAEAALKAFSFVSNYGFEHKQTLPTFVRFESPEAFVNVYHGRSSYELGVEVGRLSDNEPFSLLEVVESGGSDMPRTIQYVARSANEVVERLEVLAHLLKKHGGPALRNDSDAFRRLDDVRERKFREFLHESRFDDVRSLARKAWHMHDFGEVVRLLERIPEPERLPVERKRLMQAENQLKSAEKRS